jgi:hypothetical protein
MIKNSSNGFIRVKKVVSPPFQMTTAVWRSVNEGTYFFAGKKNNLFVFLLLGKNGDGDGGN